MGKKEKALKRLKSVPKDCTLDAFSTAMGYLELEMCNKGKTSGSAVRFRKGDVVIELHKPHPQKEIDVGALKRIVNLLEKEGFL